MRRPNDPGLENVRIAYRLNVVRIDINPTAREVHPDNRVSTVAREDVRIIAPIDGWRPWTHRGTFLDPQTLESVDCLVMVEGN